jgi:hypothetical protein
MATKQFHENLVWKKPLSLNSSTWKLFWRERDLKRVHIAGQRATHQPDNIESTNNVQYFQALAP